MAAMNTSPALESAGSPSQSKRSKRGKYTPKACLECRRRKLKCSGEDPCQRCVRHGQDCIFSEDRTQAEVLRGLTRNAVRRASPHHNLPRTSNGTISIEARMERLEAMVSALVSERQPESSRASVEPEHAGVDARDFQGDSALQAPINTFSANLAPVKLKLGISTEVRARTCSPISMNSGLHNNSQSSPSASGSDPMSSIRVGSRSLAFPTPSEYTRYIDFFFDDINPCHPCINEADFRARSDKLLSNASVDRDDACFLALNYIIFACADVLLDVSPAGETRNRLPGWRWFLAADELVGKRKVSGRGDLSLIQFLVFESFYLVHMDKPNAAYNVAGLACRVCFQFGLHQQSRWGPDCSEYETHMRQRLCWLVYFLDRRISLSCGRPYGMRDLDIDVDQPAWVDDKAVFPGRPLPPTAVDLSSNMYLSCMVAFAKLAGEVWDQVFSASASKTDGSSEAVFILDARISHWYEHILPTIPLLPVHGSPTIRHLRQQTIVKTRMLHLRLLLRRRMMVSLNYDATAGRLSGDLAVDIIQQLKAHTAEISQPSSFRFHMATSLGGTILILATLLCRPLSVVGLQEKQPEYADFFRDGVQMLRDLARNLQSARRIVDDLEDIVQVVMSILNGPPPSEQAQMDNVVPPNIDDLFPYGVLGYAQQTGAPSDRAPDAFNYDNLNSVDWWDAEAQRNVNGYGVPWI